MKKIKLLIQQESKYDLLIWDTKDLYTFKESLSNYNWKALNCRNITYISPKFLFKSVITFLIKYKNLKYCESRHNKSISPRSFKKKIEYHTNFLRKTISSILTISAIFHYKPKLLISRMDNSKCFMFIDALMHEYMPIITIQNGNRWHSDKLLTIKKFKHFYTIPSFHSCFAALSLIDIDMYKKNNWKCYEYHNIGSVSADSRRISAQKTIKYDICIVASSKSNRLSDIKLSELINNYHTYCSPKIVVALKRAENEPDFSEHYNGLNSLYKNCAELIPRGSSGANLAMSSKVVTGTFTTAFRELLGMGKKIYPINFDQDELNFYWNGMNINHKPTQIEFNNYMDKLLTMDDEIYTKEYSSIIKYIGAFQEDQRPLINLKNLIDSKILERIEPRI